MLTSTLWERHSNPQRRNKYTNQIYPRQSQDTTFALTNENVQFELFCVFFFQRDTRSVVCDTCRCTVVQTRIVFECSLACVIIVFSRRHSIVVIWPFMIVSANNSFYLCIVHQLKGKTNACKCFVICRGFSFVDSMQFVHAYGLSFHRETIEFIKVHTVSQNSVIFTHTITQCAIVHNHVR